MALFPRIRWLNHRLNLSFVHFVSFVVKNPDLCEVRVPTCRRPEWLRRALQSLIDQTHRNWAALVLEDSPDGEGETVVRGLGDARITYRKNERQLGAAGNIDRAFATGPLLGGGFACVLEDDNWLKPACLEENLGALARSGCSFLMRDQSVWRGEEAGESTGDTTLGQLYCEGLYEPMRLRARLFFGLGIANGALFWRTDAASHLEVGPQVSDTVLQEHCRTLQIEEPVWFAKEPLAVWSMPQGEGKAIVPGPQRVLSRGRQSLHRRLWQRYGFKLMPELLEIAQRSGRMTRLAETLGYIGVRMDGVPLHRFVGWRVRSALRVLSTPDPLAGYFAARFPIDVHAT